MDTYLVVRELIGCRWLYAVKVMVPDGWPEPLAFYSAATDAHADADRMSALKPEGPPSPGGAMTLEPRFIALQR